MLQDVDKTLENILRERGKIPRDDIDIVFDQPTGEWSATLSRPTLNLYCFDLRENLKLRRPDYDINRSGNRSVRSKPPSRIDLSYLVTAWARKVEDEHRLLWRALHVLKSMPVIKPGHDGVGGVREQFHEIPIWVADTSIIDQRYNITDIWSVMDNQMRLGFLLVLTVELALDIEIEAPLVLEGDIRVSQIQHEATEEEQPERNITTTREDGVSTGDDLVPDVRIVHKSDQGDE
jgi:hypothetical protein